MNCYLRTKTIANIELSINTSVLAIVFVLRLSRISDRYAPELLFTAKILQEVMRLTYPYMDQINYN